MRIIEASAGEQSRLEYTAVLHDNSHRACEGKVSTRTSQLHLDGLSKRPCVLRMAYTSIQ